MLATFQSSNQYLVARHAYEQGPQQHRIRWADPATSDPTVRTGSAPAAGDVARQFLQTAGVRAVITNYSIDATAVEPSTSQTSLFIPAASAQIAPILGQPTGFSVFTVPGQAPRASVQATADRLSVHAFLEDLVDYQAVQGYQLLLSTLAVIVLGIGLLAVLITTIDRAIERRRQVAGQVALGVPIRVLRGSQLLQTLLPLWLGLVAAIGLGYLTVLAYLEIAAADTPIAAPTQTIGAMALAALVGAAVVAAATLPGIGARLTPDLLRRE